MENATRAPIDYSAAFPNAMIAQGQGNNVLILSKLDKPSTDRFDGKRASYEVIYRWLSVECDHPDDQAWACVTGSEVTYWQRKELKEELFNRIKDGTINLFNQFRLY